MHDRNSATAVRQSTRKNQSERTFNTECVLCSSWNCPLKKSISDIVIHI